MLEAGTPEGRIELVGARVVHRLRLERLARLSFEGERETPMHGLHVVLANNPARIARIDILPGIATLHQLDIEQPSNLSSGFAHAIEVAHA